MKTAVVIPALDEAGQIEGAVESARIPEENVEVLVVDGGSRDDTADRARSAGAKVLRGQRGRALQLEAGWRAVSADAVVFLHADSRLPPGWLDSVRAALADPGVAGGAFRLRFDQRSGGLRVIELSVHVRVALFGLPYGDQAIFVRRSVLEDLGGIPDAAVMEDLDLVDAMKAHGRVVALPLPVVTSARRYLREGALRTVLRHGLALAAWRLGVDRQRVASWVHR